MKLGTEAPARSTPPMWSIGLRPFFLGAALFAALAVPVWALLLAVLGDAARVSAARTWHIHEMIFGFLPAVMTGFLLTAIPNWTDRPPVRGTLLRGLFLLWLAGRIAMAVPLIPASVAALTDGLFLFAVAAVVWREIGAGGSWRQAPIAVLITLYAVAGAWFHALRLTHQDSAGAERLALGCLMVLLTVIGGRVTPAFTAEWLGEEETGAGSWKAAVDAVTIAGTVAAAGFWIASPDGMLTGPVLMTAGAAHLARWIGWRGWRTWREPLVLVLHVGYGWITATFWLLGAAVAGVGLPVTDALHSLTAGAVGVMTLAIMTRASLGHTGRLRHAGPGTVALYALVNLGALFRVFGPSTPLGEGLMLGLAAFCWSGAYAGFSVLYAPFLLRPSLDE